MQITVGEDDESAVLGTGILAGLLLADEGIFVFGLCLQNYQGKTTVVEKEEINKTAFGFLEVLPEFIEIRGFDSNSWLELDVSRLVTLREKTPAGNFE